MYTNQEKFLEDVRFLVITFLQRGSVTGKIAKKSSRDYLAVLRILIAKYGIRREEVDRRRRAEALGPEVTLPRIAAFPQMTTVYFHNEYGRVIISKSDFHANTPNVLFSPMFPSVVRKANKENNRIMNIHPQLMLIAILVDNVLHLRDRLTSLDQIWTYYLASYQTNVIIDSMRIEQCNLFEITYDGKFSDILPDVRDHCINRIRELRPHDRLEDIIREMNTLEF